MSDEKLPKFQIGDIVKLKSGGPDMTISTIHQPTNSQTGANEFSGDYSAKWFAGKKAEIARFHEDTLEKVLIKS